MNRYPLWKYIAIVVALLLGLLYTLPNFFGEDPAVQVSLQRSSTKVDTDLLGRVGSMLKAANIAYQGASVDGAGVKVRFKDTDTQLKAKDVLQGQLGDGYVVALNLLSASPGWLQSLHALPMFLGLDLRGGVHFLLQVDMKAALDKKFESYTNDIRAQLRDKSVRHTGITREGTNVVIHFRDAETRDKARAIITEQLPDLQLADAG